MSSNSFPKTIKAVGFNKNGDVDVIEELTGIPFPESADDAVTIKVEYGGVNFIDTYLRAGLYPTDRFPRILGEEVSGTVVKVPTSKAILDDPHFQLRVGDKVATAVSGAFAEYVTSPAWKVSKLPPNVDTSVGAAVILQGLTALTFAREAYEIKKGDTVLIYAAAGGVGSILTGIALHFGATVIATVSSETKAKFVRELGAQHVIISTQQNVVEEVLKITNGNGVHGIFDGIGKDTFEDNFKVARRKGTIVSLGNASGPAPPFVPLRLAEKNLKICRPKLGNYIATPDELRAYTNELFDLLGKGAFKVTVHETYPFTAEGVCKSHQDISSRGTIGKLLVNIGGAASA